MYTQELYNKLHKRLEYCKDGTFKWKIALSKRCKVGEVAGSYCKEKNRYYLRFDNKLYPISRLVFFYHNGYISNCIDHIDRNEANNRIENLRIATESQNRVNSKKKKQNGKCTSLYKGVSFNKEMKKWSAYIKWYGKSKYLGSFDSETDAAKTYDLYAKKQWGEYANTNFKN